MKLFKELFPLLNSAAYLYIHNKDNIVYTQNAFVFIFIGGMILIWKLLGLLFRILNYMQVIKLNFF